MYIGIDIGGGSVKIGLVTKEGLLIDKQESKINDKNNPELIIHTYYIIIQNLLTKNKISHIKGIGVGVSGHINNKKTKTNFCNVPVLNNYPIKNKLQNLFKIPCSIENDATMAALGEYKFGSTINYNRFLYITLGTGIGLGIINNGKVFTTANGTIGDAGHIIVSIYSKSTCRLGCRGCLESLATSETLIKQSQLKARKTPNSYLGKILTKRNCIKLKDILRGVKKEDPISLECFSNYCNWLSIGIFNWVQVFKPNTICIGGGISVFGQILINTVNSYIICRILSKTEYDNIGLKIEKLRINKKLSRMYLSKKMNISVNHLNLIENNKISIPIPLLIKFNKILNFSIKNLIDSNKNKILLKSFFAENFNLIISKLGNNAGIIGAATLTIKKIKDV